MLETDDKFKPLTIKSAVELTASERKSTFQSFFFTYGIDKSTELGYGLALMQFMLWEIDSTRITDDLQRGSDWFKAVNGFMVLDLEIVRLFLDNNLTLESISHLYKNKELLSIDVAALSQSRNVSSYSPIPELKHPFVKWLIYTASNENNAQINLWNAHQASMHNAVEICAELKTKEALEEIEFIRIVLSLLEINAKRLTPTNTEYLGKQAKTFYPNFYPADSATVNRLAEIEKKALLKFS